MGLLYKLLALLRGNGKCSDCDNRVEVKEDGQKRTVIIDKERCDCCEAGEQQ